MQSIVELSYEFVADMVGKMLVLKERTISPLFLLYLCSYSF